MEIGITKMSSKGQIVIPFELRKGFESGDKIFIIKNKNQIILKNAATLEENFSQDLEFSKKTQKAIEKIERGEGIKMNFEDFIEEMKKW